MTYRRWIAFSALALLLAITVAVVTIWIRTRIDTEFTAVALAEPDCDLQQNACDAQFADGGRITLALMPRPVRSLELIQIQVRTEGMVASSVEVDFRGLAMYMGYNRLHLTEGTSGQFAGTGMLASCLLERMTWEATVLARTDQGIVAATFPLETLKP